MKHLGLLLIGSGLVAFALACGSDSDASGAAGSVGGQGGATGGQGGATGGQGGATGGQGGATGGQGGATGGQGGQGADDCLANKGITADLACERWGKAICAKAEECFSAFLGYAEVSECEKRETMNCKEDSQAPGIGYTPAYTATTAALLEKTQCVDVLFGDLDRPEGATCGSLHGTIADGKTCFLGAQCLKDRECAFEGNALCGVCTPLSTAGQACEQPWNCASGLTCIDKKCVAPLAANATCASPSDCAEGLSCNAELKCAPKVAIGGSCVEDTDCEGTSTICGADKKCKTASAGEKGADCVDETLSCNWMSNFVCDETTKKCIDGPIVKVGESCESKDICASGADCVGDKCTLPATDGSACDPTAGPLCLSPAHCVDKKCQFSNVTTCPSN